MINQMKTGKKLLLMTLIVGLILGLAGAAFAANLSDLDGHWAKAEIENWVEQELAAGYPDGTFNPDKEISRAEFVVLVNKAFDVEKSDAECEFVDVMMDDWFCKDVVAAKAAGYISGYEDSTFKPNQEISRQEVAVIVARLLELDTSGDLTALDKFVDAADIPEWAKSSLNAVVKEGIVNGYPDDTVLSFKSITRAEAIFALNAALKTTSSTPPAVVNPTRRSGGGGGGDPTPTIAIAVPVDRTVVVGGTITVSVKTTPSDAVVLSFSSNKQSVATVEQATGEITGIAEGEATITVTARKSGYRSDTKTFKVTVCTLEGVKELVSDVVGNDADLELNVGESTITATIKDSDTDLLDSLLIVSDLEQKGLVPDSVEIDGTKIDEIMNADGSINLSKVPEIKNALSNKLGGKSFTDITLADLKGLNISIDSGGALIDLIAD